MPSRSGNDCRLLPATQNPTKRLKYNSHKMNYLRWSLPRRRCQKLALNVHGLRYARSLTGHGNEAGSATDAISQKRWRLSGGARQCNHRADLRKQRNKLRNKFGGQAGHGFPHRYTAPGAVSIRSEHARPGRARCVRNKCCARNGCRTWIR